MIRKIGQFQNDPYNRPNEDIQRLQIGEVGAEDGDFQISTSSLRFSRRKLTFAITAFVLGAILVLLQSPMKNEFLAPGALSSSHAQILAGQGAERCAACHDIDRNQNFSAWLSNAFRTRGDAASCQSELCLKCHQETINAEFATKPHNVDPKLLVSTSSRRGSIDALFSPVDHSGNIECSACHREHHGSVDLKVMTDRQCQTCHSEKYHSFESDHPEFTSWSNKRRQAIAFDHVSHNFKHFPGMEKTFDCKMCHVDDQFGSVKQLSSYEQTCGQCHDKDIRESTEPGLQLVSLPMLDLEAIGDQAMNVGQWPENASGDFDGEIPALMRMLLFKDKTAAEILESRGEDFEFADLDPGRPDDVADAVKLAWAIKYLFYDLAQNGVNELRSRIEFSLQRSLTEEEFFVLVGGLDSSVFENTANQWLPKLGVEVPIHRRAKFKPWCCGYGSFGTAVALFPR